MERPEKQLFDLLFCIEFESLTLNQFIYVFIDILRDPWIQNVHDIKQNNTINTNKFAMESWILPQD